MRHSFLKNSQLLSILLCLVIISCKKDSAATNSDSISKTKRSWISGTWKQKDIVLGYPVDFGGQQLPVGYSVYNITSYLPVSGPLLDCTKDNTYTFNSDSSYTINGCTELMLPNAGNAGKWRMEIYDAVIRLTSSANKTAPYWTNNISAKEWSIGLTVYLAEVDANLPVNLILEKQ
jgi:hypothetical protein